MSEFLHSIRNNNIEKKYHKPRRNYNENNAFPTLEKRNGLDRRAKPHKKNNINVGETLETIKNLLEDIQENQQQTLFAQERKVYVIERKADILEKMAGMMEKIANVLSNSTLPTQSAALNGGPQFNIADGVPRKPTASDRKIILEIIEKMRGEGETYNTIAQFLEKEAFPTFSGKGEWHAQTVHRLCQRLGV